MPYSERDIVAQLASAMTAIASLKELHEQNKKEIEALKKRVSDYDLLAAKWGGICMFAVGLGAWAISNYDRAKAWVIGGVKP